MRLLELCLSPDLGGLELYMVRAAKALHESNSVISVINPKGKLEQYYKETNYKYELIEKKSNLFMFGAAKKLANIIDKNQIEVVHLHWTKDIPIAVLAKLMSKQKPKLAQTRNMTMTRFKDDFYHRFLYQNIDLMLPVTKQVASQINTFIPEDIRPKVEVLYMGTEIISTLNEEKRIELKESLGMDKCFSVGIVGRVEETKGQHLLIEAVSHLRKNGMAVSAFFVGHEMQEGYIETLKVKAKSLDISEYVTFLGFMKKPAEFMQACDVMVLATECETFGLVVIEAMAVGTPIIATNQCGPLEIIDDGVSGLLFEQNSTQSLTEQIAQLECNIEMRTNIKIQARAIVEERFSNIKQFEKLEKILKEQA